MSARKNSVHCWLRAATTMTLAVVLAVPATAQTQPNILWLTSEDNGPHLGCYGDTYADTPNLDALATKSLRFKRCWSNAPVCAAARTSLISGMYACSLGAEHMRSAVRLPEDIQLYPQVMRSLGYYCTNNSKTDYNFTNDDAGWHESSKKAHWRNRPDPKTPFLAVFNTTISHESQIRNKHTLIHDPAKAPVPAYHPDRPEVRRDWAQYYDRLTQMDTDIGKVLRELEEDGLADSTIIFYYGDHGSGMPRSKRWTFNSGLHVPLIVHFPERFAHLAPTGYNPGAESDQLVSFVDFAPTIISLAGAKTPEYMQGHAFAGEHASEPQKYVFGFRGRMDERIDLERVCTDGRFVYMKHFYPERPYLKHVNYMFETPTTKVWKAMFDAGELNEVQAKFWQPKPCEELFDLEADPDETRNLAEDTQYRSQLDVMRKATRDWLVEIADAGLLTEAEMHRRFEDVAPRTAMTHPEFPINALVDAAFLATSSRDANDLDQVLQLARHADPAIQFWGVRGLVLRTGNEAQRSRITDALQNALASESPSVQIAACEGLLLIGSPSGQTKAVEQLLELANVQSAGNYAAVQSLNVVDMNWNVLTAEQKKRLISLPRQLPKSPGRVSGYAGRLLEYMETRQ